MNWEQVAAVAEVLGALGVIASVLYLAFQIKGERDATLANTRQLRQGGVRESMLALATSDDLASVFARTGVVFPAVSDLVEELGISREEAIRMNAFYTATVRQLETNLRMPMTEEEIEQTHATMRALFRGPVRVWWRRSQAGYSRGFVDVVEALTTHTGGS